MKFAYLVPAVALVAVTGVHAAEPTPAISQNSNGEIVFRDYPTRAQAAGEQGKVGFRIQTDSNGYPTSCSVTRSSGHSKLDQETCQLLTIHAKFEPVQAASGAQALKDGVVSWVIPANAVVPKELSAARKPRPKWSTARSRLPDTVVVKVAEADGGQQICKRVPRTGTLAGFERICRTKSDWEKTSEANGWWAQQQGRAGSTYGN